MEIAILGAGALGSVIGAHLHGHGHAVTLVDVNEVHVDTVAAEGLRVDWDDVTETLPLKAVLPQHFEGADLIVVLTKTYQTDEALGAIAGPLGRASSVLTLQNGLGNAERLARHIPRERILFGCTLTPGDFLAPGHVTSHGLAHSPVWYAARPDTMDTLDALGAAGFDVTEAAAAQVWQKAAFNCAMNAISALGEGTVGAMRAHISRDLLHAIAAEVIALAQAEEVEAVLAPVAKQIGFAMEHHTHHKTSMLQDVEAGRPSEIASLNGYVAARAPRHRLSTPLNKLLAELILMREAQRGLTS